MRTAREEKRWVAELPDSAFWVELRLRSLSEEPTMAGLAERIEAVRRAARSVSAPPLMPVPQDAHPPPSFAQQRLWFLDQMERGSSAYNILRVVRMFGQLKLAVLKRSFEEMVNRHEVL